MKLNIYMGYEKDSCGEGAVLVFAHTAKEARKLAYGFLHLWFDGEWINSRAKRLWNGMHLYSNADQDKLGAGIPHVIDSPTSCSECHRWGSIIGDDGICDVCRNGENNENRNQ